MTTHLPPDSGILPSEWREMSPEERLAAWAPPKNPELPTLPPYNEQQTHRPPGSDLSFNEWLQMSPEERTKEWSNSVPHVEGPTLPSDAAQQAGAPPNSNINSHEWREMTPQERTQAWSSYVTNNTQFVANPQLREFLQDPANKDITTFQELINHHTGDYKAIAADLGLNPDQMEAYFRDARLMDFAVVRPTPANTLPTDVGQANVFHLVEFNTSPYGTPYNTSYPGKDPYSDNCGPAALAMALRITGDMPAGLNAEQQIDYARYLITHPDPKAPPDPNNPKQVITTVTVAPGVQLPVVDNDMATLGFQQIEEAQGLAGVPMTTAHGWVPIDDSLAAGHPIVAAGYITPEWKAQFPEQGTYGNTKNDLTGHFVAVVGKTPDGKYLVSDPMWTGGAITMTRDQLQMFFTRENINVTPTVTVIGQ